MRIDRDIALRVLEAEATNVAPVPEQWAALVSQLSEECERGANKTFIAMLGTALLARATNLRADPFALKTGPGTPGAYSARALCQHVLAANAPRLEIDLGVTGREPLNNQPFFAEDRVHANMPVHQRAKEGFQILMECLEKISRIGTEAEARNALRAFIAGRVENRYRGQLRLGDEDSFTFDQLIRIAKKFVRTDSEYGRRAQAVAAGFLDATSSCSVAVSQVHDPDRHFPGDVYVTREGGTVTAFEVRDKAVNEPDAYHFVNKVSSANVNSAGIITIATKQERLDGRDLEAFAQGKSVNLHVFYSWEEFLAAASFWGDRRPDWQLAIEKIHSRALELGVSEAGIRQWESLCRPE